MEIQQPQYVEPDWSAGQCLGWRATRIGDHVYHNHGGGIHGFGTQVWFDIPRKTGVVVLINMWPPHGGLEIAQEVLEMVLNADEAVPLVPEQPALEPTPEALRRFVGYYRAEPGIDVDIAVRDGSLRLAAHGGSAYSYMPRQSSNRRTRKRNGLFAKAVQPEKSPSLSSTTIIA